MSEGDLILRAGTVVDQEKAHLSWLDLNVEKRGGGGTGEFWEWFNKHRKRMLNRESTWQQVFAYLDKFERPVTIIETGCVREEDDFEGAGYSTVLFDKYVQDRGGIVHSVDNDPEHTALARQLVSDKVHLHNEDSVEYLKSWTGDSPDLVYLDSLDYMESDAFLTALHCGNEFEAIRLKLRPDSLVVCDDTPCTFIKGIVPRMELYGKGAFVAVHAEKTGAKIQFQSYQIGWTNMVKEPIPRDAQIERLIGRAREQVEAAQVAEAEKLYRVVLSKTTPPKSAIERVARGEACVFFARLASSVSAYGTAIDWYRDAIIADPRAVDYRLEMVVKGYRPMNEHQLARQEALRAVAIEPDSPHAWRILGDTEMTLCDIKRTIQAYDKQLELAPDDPNAMLDRCVISLDTSDYELTEKLIEKVLKTDRRADGLHVLAMIANRQGRHEDAIKLFDEAIAAGCNNVHIAHWNKSLSLHAIGRFREGWIAHEERRHEKYNLALSLGFQRFTRPVWEGEPPPALIHVHAESGMGDNICFSRFLNMLTDRGYQVRYETHRELTALMARSFPKVEVVERAPDYPGAIGLKPFDYHLPLGTMAYSLDIDIDTVPNKVPYLVADPVLVSEYAKKLKPGVPKVGLCWSSGIREYGIWIEEYGKRKSMHFDKLRPLIRDNPEVQFVSLQVGPERYQNDKEIIEVLPEAPNWDDTAALVENLDLIITVDTGVTHLAGALAKPLWVMTPRDAATWHFMCWRPGASWNEKSPWYPTARLFRQHEFNTPHYWDEVVKDVAVALQHWNKQSVAA